MSKGITNVKLAGGEAYLEALGPNKRGTGRGYFHTYSCGDKYVRPNRGVGNA
jgi:hypothetical protein